ncbi:flagellar basal body L-ring protein FlgH [Duganella sp. CF458]|uniref:flagellar basal body L-ring protein FlgH n=1 Tax=Duganella sp. CF458 TaxID=1884368 RepID=UPI001E412548|nr:flagellar basal body L-ring protein FlgH [Duganella sp. CF458]
MRAVLKGMLLLVLLAGAPARADSLYQPQSYQPLTSDLRQRRVGDLVTVMVYENASASSSANTRAGRNAQASLDAQVPNGRAYGAGIQANNEMDGHGTTQRAGKVLAQLTVSVREIAPNGDLLVSGTQLLDINNERQTITLEGRVRPQDISDTNVVLSTRVADARISYAGQGDLADRQRPAWWQRLLNLFGV